MMDTKSTKVDKLAHYLVLWLGLACLVFFAWGDGVKLAYGFGAAAYGFYICFHHLREEQAETDAMKEWEAMREREKDHV